jgi:hypothetical protein
MDIKERLLAVYQNKKQRNIIILTLLMIVLSSIILHQLMNPVVPPPPGAKRVVICKKCRKTDIQRVYDITKAKCKYCGGPVAFAWKCGKCQYEYYPEENKKVDTSKLNTMQRLQRAVKEKRCPNCGMERDTRPMTIQDMK